MSSKPNLRLYSLGWWRRHRRRAWRSNRNVIHPKFGSFILLGTVLLAAEVTVYDRPIDYNPCVEYRPELFVNSVATFLELMDVHNAIVCGESIG